MAQIKLNQYKSKENKHEHYFVICSKCGSIEWLDFEDGNMINNTLNDKGQMLSPRKLWTFELDDEDTTFLCQNCENPNHPIPFSETTPKLRKKLAQEGIGKDKYRRNWVKNYLMLQKLKDEDEKPKDSGVMKTIKKLSTAFFSVGILSTGIGLIAKSLKEQGIISETEEEKEEKLRIRKEKQRINYKKYYEKNKERLLTRHKNYIKSEKGKEYLKGFRKRKRDYIREKNLIDYYKHKEKRQKKMKEYYENNKDYFKQYYLNKKKKGENNEKE